MLEDFTRQDWSDYDFCRVHVLLASVFPSMMGLWSHNPLLFRLSRVALGSQAISLGSQPTAASPIHPGFLVGVSRLASIGLVEALLKLW